MPGAPRRDRRRPRVLGGVVNAEDLFAFGLGAAVAFLLPGEPTMNKAFKLAGIALALAVLRALVGCSGDVSVLEAEPEPEPEIVEVRADVTLRDEAGAVTATCEAGQTAADGWCVVYPIHGAELAEAVSEPTEGGWTCGGRAFGVVRVTARVECEVTP